MESAIYHRVRGQLEEYFDRTAAEAWARLTSAEPVGRIRATVRAGRERMRATLLGYLPADLRGRRVLDAGCGTGALAVEAARRGAEVLAIDLSPTLVRLGRERLPSHLGAGSVELRVADMMDPALGEFDWIVAMDSIIHYPAAEMVEIIARLAARARRGLALTFAPRTPLLAAMHVVGRAFPRGNRAPAIAPIGERALRERLAGHARFAAGGHGVGRSERVDCGFYISQSLEVVRA